MLITDTGIVLRALPTAEGMTIKLLSERGALLLDIPANRPELIEAARLARMNGEDVVVRHTRDDMVVALQAPVAALAA